MAYQKVGTPRFYIDHMQYLKSINFDFQKWYDDYGFDDTNKSKKSVFNDPDIFTFNPETQKQVFSKHTLIDGSTNVNYLYWDMPTASPNGTNFTSDNVGFFVAMLNHNLKTKGLSPYFERSYNTAVAGVTENSIINYNRGGIPNEDGFSIYETSNINPDIADNEPFFRLVFYDPSGNGNATDFNIGALSCGFYYDMPVNPDLDLSMSIEYDGFTNIKTLSGHTITQSNYQGSPWWYDINGNKVEPWSVGQSTGISKRNGRRVWKLKFSYMSDKDLFASNYGSSTYAEDVLPYESGDQDIPNLGANLLFDGDFNTDVSANTTPAGGRDSGTGWGTDSYTSLIDGTSTISGGLANLRQMSQADNETIEGSDEWTSSITSTAKNWRLYQNNVFKTSDTSLSESDNNRNKKIIYRVSFRAKYVDVDNAGDFLQLGAGYHRFFQQPMTSTFANYEVEFSFDDTPSDDNDLSSNFADAWNHSHAHKLTIGSYPAGDAHTTGWENHFQIEWIKVQQHNPSDFYYTIDNDDSFSAQVLNKISHGEKFIFQPDNTSNNPSDFAICVLDGDSFEMKRTAWNVYDIEMTIREVW